jgi:hypothetical protein
MIKTKLLVSFLLGILLASAVRAVSGHKQVTIGVTILDEKKPLAGVTVRGGFEQFYGSRPAASVEILSDTNGYASISEDTSGDISLTVKKEGYYKHYESMKLLKMVNFGPFSTNRVLCLKRVNDPVPMYVKKEKRLLPKTDEFFGYDFEIGDWVAPHGSGKTVDVLFNPYFSSTDRYNYTVKLEINFTGEYNGIQSMPREYPERQGSSLRSAHEAPEKGYVNALNMSRFRKGRIEDRGDFSEKNREGYYFRIRSTVDAQGNLISAQYGKIYGSFDVYGGILGEELGLAFCYYYNPDKTQNVEFDPEQNLFLKKDGYYLPSYKGGSKYGISRP